MPYALRFALHKCHDVLLAQMTRVVGISSRFPPVHAEMKALGVSRLGTFFSRNR